MLAFLSLYRYVHVYVYVLAHDLLLYLQKKRTCTYIVRSQNERNERIRTRYKDEKESKKKRTI